MKTTTFTYSLILAGFVAACRLHAATIAGAGGTYATPFAPADDATFDPAPFGSPLGTHLVLNSSGSTSVTSGLWTLNAQGGSNITVLGIAIEQSGAQTALTGTALEFNRDNQPSSTLLGLLGTGTNLHYGWTATAAFGGFTYAANSQYILDFHVDGHNGLLQTIAGLTPSFTAEFIDGSGNTLALQGGGTTIDLIGLLGSGVTSGDVSLVLNTGSVAPAGTVAIKFTGNASVSAAALGIGTNFATVNNLNLNVTPVPEPAGAVLIMVCGMCVMFRRRRLAALS